MRKRKAFLDTLTSVTKINADILPCIPLVEVCGCHRVLIENHKSILAYSTEEVCVKVRFGTITVTGRELQLSKMSREQLFITGNIEGVILRRGSSDDTVV